MLLTACQRYILDCLREVPYIRREHLQWLLRLGLGMRSKQLDIGLAQLAYLKKITLYADDHDKLVALPQQQRDGKLLEAVDVMAAVCGDSLPEFFCGELPCVLSFYLKDERGYLDFKVIPVPMGAEQRIMEQLRRQYPKFKCTWLFLPESHEQIEKLHTENPACFVFRNEAGGYDFLRKQ